MQITIHLDDKARRPIANLNWFTGCRALIDTGALFLIWNKSEKILEEKLGTQDETKNNAGKIFLCNICFKSFYYVYNAVTVEREFYRENNLQ